jgi:tetratricopeptide (TPR) repeat protein
MATNKNRQAAAPVSAKQRPIPKTESTKSGNDSSTLSGNKRHALIAGIISLITWFFYRVCLDNQLTNWDDPGYIRDNALIKDISGEGLNRIFSTPIMGNYHPLTILSYAIEYSYVRLEPWLYHLDSLLLHIVVTVLVYYFVLTLTRRTVAAAVAALLFGLHPMHVESVAWLAGRKDVLYGAFYMAACLAHLYYLRTTGSKKKLWYAGVLLLFLCSLLAKPVAVTLPITLLLIDYFEQQEWKLKNLLEKLPLLAMSVGFGIRSMIDQKAFGSMETKQTTFSALERIALGGYAFITYLWKAVLPMGLSCFYPYPTREGGSISSSYYIYPLLTIGILALIWWFRKNKVVLFGSLFFLVNIALLLQFIPVGGAIIADRYSYIAYLGIFFMAGWAVSGFFEGEANKQKGYIAMGVVGAYCLYLGALTTERCKAWYDTASLWRDEIEKQPNAPNAFNNLGFYYFNKFNESVNEQDRRVYFDSSYNLLNTAIKLDAKFANPVVSLGELHRAANKFYEAREYYYQGLKLNDKEGNANAYLGLAIIYAISRNTDSSMICFRNAIGYKYHFPEAHSNMGNLFDMMHMTDSALKEYGVAVSQNPDMYAPYLNRARLLLKLKRYNESMSDFENAMRLNPDMGEIYYSRSYCYFQMGNRAAAVQDVQKALSLGFKQVDPAYYAMLQGR